ncbi:MAG: ParA family protein [Phycisphaerae bacterium]|jgi:chromosome partitioning protein
MRSIAFINQKGGVGKTTSAVNVAAALSRVGRRVLLVDLDPQSHASLHLGLQPADGEITVYDVLVRGAPLAEAARFADQRLTVVPSNIHLVGAEVELVSTPERERCLLRAISPHRENFDVLVVDCSPSLGLLTVNALACVGEVIIPLQPHFLALQGLGRLLETITLVRSHINPELRVLGVLMCMYERGTRLAQEVIDDVRGFLAAATPEQPWSGARVFRTLIRRNIKLAECPSFGQSIFTYAPGSHGAEDYAALAAELTSDGAPQDGIVAAATADAYAAPLIPEAARAIAATDSASTAAARPESAPAEPAAAAGESPSPP